MTYDELLEAADDLGLIAKEKDLQAHDGLGAPGAHLGA